MKDALRTAFPTTAWACALLVMGSLSISQAWSGPVPALLLSLAAVVPLLVLRGVVHLGVSRWAAATVLTMLLVLLAYLLSARAETTLTSTVSDALPLLLSEPQPLVVRADLLAAPVLACGVAGTLVGLRLGAVARVAPVIGASVLYAAGLLLTSGSGDRFGLLAGLILLTSVAGWALLDDHTEPVRRRAGVAAPVAALSVAVVAMAAAVPAAEPFDPRDLVSTPVETVPSANPLPQLGAWAANPGLEILTVSGPEVPLRLVTLDDYDGVHWSSATRYAAFGTGGGDRGLPAGLRQQEITQRIDLLDLVGPWLPTPGGPRSTSIREALLDPRSGTVYLDDRPDQLSYTVSGRRDAPERAALANATVPSGDDLSAYLAVPDLTYPLAEYSRAVTRDAATPYDRALAIEAAVRGNRRFTTKVISGSAYWRIERFLLGEKGEPGAQVGSSEQFATAFAIIARQNGLPTRLVVGFRPGEPNDEGTRTVRGRDAMAWPEVYFAGLGWVPFSPLPDDTTFAHEDVDSTPLQSAPPKPAQSGTPTPSGDAQPHGDKDTAAPRASASDDSAVWWPILVPVLLVGVPLLLLFALRRLRSLRHRRTGARGAWAEVLDALTLLGAPAAHHESATDVAGRVDHLLDSPGAHEVAALAERAAFGPDTVATTWPPAADAVRRAARRSLPIWRRAWWWFDPRPLTRRRTT